MEPIFLSHFKPLKPLKVKGSFTHSLDFSGNGVPLNPFLPNILSHGYWCGLKRSKPSGKDIGCAYFFYYTGTGPYASSAWGTSPDVLWVKHEDADVELLSTIGTRASDKCSMPLKFPSGAPIGYRYDYAHGGQFLLKPHKAKLDKLPFTLPISLITPDRNRPPSVSDTMTPNAMSHGGDSSPDSDQEGPDFDVNSRTGLGEPHFKDWLFTEEEPEGIGKPLHEDWLISFSDSDSDS